MVWVGSGGILNLLPRLQCFRFTYKGSQEQTIVENSRVVLSKTFFVGNTQLLGIVDFSFLSWQGSLGFKLIYFRVFCLPPQKHVQV